MAARPRRRAATLRDVQAAIHDDRIWSDLDDSGSKRCEFLLGDEKATARVTRYPPGLVVEPVGGERHVEIVLAGSYEVAGTVRRAGTITVLREHRASATALVGPDGATTLEVFSGAPSTVDVRDPQEEHAHKR